MEEESIVCVDVAAWEAWLEENHAERDSVWVRIGKKGSGVRSITAAEGTAGALCFGWIDGHRRSLDAAHFLQRYSPRRRTSSWSKVNVELAERLIAEGRMRPAGFVEIERAKADGRWEAAYVSQAEATVPTDLEEALAADPRAAEAFAAMSRTDRYASMLPLLKARTPAARRTQLERLVARLTPTDP